MAYDFDGAGDYITFTGATGLGAITAFSLSIWVIDDIPTTTGYRDMFWLGGSYDTDHNFVFQHDTSNTMEIDIRFSGTNGRWYIAVPDTAWHNYVITYASVDTTTNALFYKDGVSTAETERSTPTLSRAVSTVNTSIIGAAVGGGAEFWNGKVAEIGVWNRALTAAEAAILGAKYSPLFIPNGLVFYAHLVRGLQDLKGGVGTVTNAVVFAHPRIIYPYSAQMRRFKTAVSTAIKTFNGLAYASTKTVNGLAIASVKTKNGLA